MRILANLNDRIAGVNNMLWEIEQGNSARITRTPEGEFDNHEWLLAEAEEMIDKREHVIKAELAEGGSAEY